jgi:Zn-dependent protease
LKSRLFLLIHWHIGYSTNYYQRASACVSGEKVELAMNVIEPITWYVIFVFSATIHESAHAWAAKRGGDLTAYLGGQVSLNPLPHIKREPLGMVVFPLVSSFLMGWPFGYASAPYDPYWAHENPRKAAWMALAGPASNFAIVILCLILMKLGIFLGIFLEPDSVGFRHIVDPGGASWFGAATVLSMLFTLNLVLTVLNLIPFPPLDGCSIVTLFLSDDSARRLQSVMSNPSFGFIGFLLAWKAFDPLFNVIFLMIINLFYWGSNFR